MHTTHAEDAQRLRRLRGLDPDRYRQHRRPAVCGARVAGASARGPPDDRALPEGVGFGDLLLAIGAADATPADGPTDPGGHARGCPRRRRRHASRHDVDRECRRSRPGWPIPMLPFSWQRCAVPVSWQVPDGGRTIGSTGDTRRLVCRALVDVAVTAEDEAVARAALVAIGRVATPDLRMDLERQLEEFDRGTHWHPQAASRKRVQRVLDLMDRKLRPRAR